MAFKDKTAVHPRLDYPQLDYPQLDLPHLDLVYSHACFFSVTRRSRSDVVHLLTEWVMVIIDLTDASNDT